MDRDDENQQSLPKPANRREMGSRRVLRDIRNLVGVPAYPRAVTKRSLMENGDNGKNPNFVPHRPVTRQCSSQSCKQVARVRDEPKENEKQKQPILSIKNPHENVDDDCDAVDELPPLMAKQPKDMVDCELKEIETEDFVVDAIRDIDGLGTDNSLAVVDYVEDIYKFYEENELEGCVNPDYMSDQFDINERMRAILIDWLIEVHYKFELMDETLFLMVNIIDRFLGRKTVVRNKLQLVGVTAMLLACKYEEVSVPVVEDLILISDRAYKRDEILEMDKHCCWALDSSSQWEPVEKLMANTLQFKMSVPTPYVFMIRFLKEAQSDKVLELVSFFIIELCLVEYQMLKFRPSLLAAAAVYTAECTLKRSKHWTRTSKLHTSYSEEQLLDCSRMMVEFHQKAGVGKLTSVHRKYSTFKLGCAAKSEPALFLLDI